MSVTETGEAGLSLVRSSKVLQSVAAGYSRTFIIVNALDECHISDRPV